jgi:putative ABC transport system permease protein
MLRLVYRQLILDPWRTALTVTAVAAVVAVILVLEGFTEGLLAQLRNTVTERNADLIISQEGIANLTAARSILPQFARRDVEAVEGVAAAHPLTSMLAIYEQNGRSTPILFFVHDAGGGPRKFVAGGPAETARDIVIDRSLARKYGLQPGDAFVLSGFEFRIAGITAGAAVLFTPIAFARFDGLIDFYFESDLADDISTFPLLSYLLVELAPGADRAAVAERIEAAVPAGDVFLPERLAENDADLGRAMFGPILDLLVGIAYLIGILVIAIIMFSAVGARRRSLGVLKALGFSPGFLGLGVVLEAQILALAAFPVGLLLAAGIAAAVEAAVPLYLVLPLEPVPTIRTAIATLVFAALGALAPLGLIRRVDPGLVFRS